MCKASILAEDFRDGEEGENLGIHTGGHGLGTFSADGQEPGMCAICYNTGARMTLGDIPPTIQQHLQIGMTEPVTFIETPGSDSYVVHDLFRFDNHPDLPPVPVAVFADVGVTVEATFVPISDISAEDVMDGPVDDVQVGDSPMTMAMRLGEIRAAA